MEPLLLQGKGYLPGILYRRSGFDDENGRGFGILRTGRYPTCMKFSLVLTAGIAALLAFQAGCDPGSATEAEPAESGEQSVLSVAEDGATTIITASLQSSLPEAQGDLTEQEKQGILLMREEEKMARDVYDTLAKSWGGRPFSNISKAETTHMAAMKVLIDRYGLEDPVGGNGPGKFQSARLQKIYDDLVKRGKTSLGAALSAGAEIEDLDIADLMDLSSKTDKQDIKKVYENLTRGSENHLRAFVSVLNRRTGDDYTPKYITKEHFNRIIAGG